MARDIVFLEAVEINPVVVHGGGKAITRALERAGLKSRFIQGQRVTDEATVGLVDEVLSREINPEVVAAIRSFERPRQRFCRPGHFYVPQGPKSPGPDGEPADLGYVGEVVAVNTAPLLECLEPRRHPRHQPHRPRQRRQAL